MANTIYDLDIYRGITFSLIGKVTDDDGTVTNLTNWAISGYIKNKYSDTGYLKKLDIAIASPAASGIFTAQLALDDTMDLPVDELVYDIKGILSGTSKQFLQGRVMVYPQATN